MSEPFSVNDLLGTKYPVLLGGFLGAIVSLSFIEELGWWGRVSATITGTATSVYVTPVIMSYWPLGAATENGIAFLVGLTSMHSVPAVIAASRWIRENAARILSRRFGIGEDDE